MKEKVARQEQEIALLKAQIADGGVEGGDGLSRVEVLEVRLEKFECFASFGKEMKGNY